MERLPFLALIKREFLTNLRSRWIFCWLALFVCLSIVVLLNHWPVHDVKMTGIAPASRKLLVAFCVVLFLAGALTIPGIAGGTISIEEEAETFDHIRLTLIESTGLVAAKLINVMGIFVLFILAVLPVLGCITSLAGVDRDQLLWNLIIIGVCMLSCAAVGIMCSALFRRTQPALVASYVGMLALTGVLPLAGSMLCYFMGMYRIFDAALQNWAVFFPLSLIIEHEAWKGWHFACAIAYQTFFATVCFVLCVRIVNRPRRPGRSLARKFPRPAELLNRGLRRILFRPPGPGIARKPIPDVRNPVLAKELRYGTVGGIPVLVGAFCACFLVFSILGISMRWHSGSTFQPGGYNSFGHEWTVWMMVFQSALILIVTPAVVSGTLCKEHELGNMDMLRMTLLSPRHIVMGKLLYALMVISPLLPAAVLSNAAIWMIAPPAGRLWPGAFDVLFTGYATLMVSTLLSLSLGLFSSLLTKRTRVSILVSYGLSLAVFIGMLLIDRDVAILSPIAAFAGDIPGFYFAGRRPSPLSIHWCLVMVTYLIASCSLIVITVAGFAKYRMRER